MSGIVQSVANIPSLKGFDHTLAFLREGYPFISKRCDALGTDRFSARLMFKPVICARGAAAAQMFYGGERFTRRGGALPPTVLRLLQDKGSVQQLDGDAHRHRKTLFVNLLMDEEAETAFLDIFRAEWRTALDGWLRQGSIVLFDEVNLVLTRAICRWAGLSFEGRGDTRMADDLVSMIENAGKAPPPCFSPSLDGAEPSGSSPGRSQLLAARMTVPRSPAWPITASWMATFSQQLKRPWKSSISCARSSPSGATSCSLPWHSISIPNGKSPSTGRTTLSMTVSPRKCAGSIPSFPLWAV